MKREPSLDKARDRRPQSKSNKAIVVTTQNKAARLIFIHDYIVNATGWRRVGLAVAAGALSTLAMAPFFFLPVLFFTLPTLVWLIDPTASTSQNANSGNDQGLTRETLVSAANVGWWFGFGYFLTGLFWIGEAFLVEAHIFGWLMPFAVISMPAGLALFTAAMTAAARAFWSAGFERVFVLAISFGVFEWLRGHIFTGFPWNTLGYALTQPLSLMQSVSLIGVYGLTPWAVLICSTPAVCFFRIEKKRTTHVQNINHALLLIFLFTMFPLLAMYGYGLTKLSAGLTHNVANVKLRLVQPSTPQPDKWRADKQEEIFFDHLSLSKMNADGRLDDAKGVTHVIWPEAAMPFLPLSAPRALEKIGEMLPEEAHLIAGALRVDRPAESPIIDYESNDRRRVFNSLIAFDSSGKPTVIYDKIHLVPFGEYLPFQQTLEAIGLRQLTRLRGGFTIGERPRQTINISGLPPLVALICYEVIFPGAIIQTTKRPSLLINLTNDGWFGNTTGPYQHFHQSRVRAVEEGLPLIRSANNGISAVIDPFGRVLHQLDLNQRGTLDAQLPSPAARTVFTQHSKEIFIMNLLLFVLLAYVVKALRKN